MVYPDYYTRFRCTADKCRHNCCIGWEIDIDEETLSYYDIVPGDIGQRIRDNITYGDPSCFKMTADNRCPMLNERGLCEIMLNLGADSVCDICYEHPRFYNDFDTHTECGLGLCCEAACRMIIDNKDIVKLEGYTDDMRSVPDVILRDRVICCLQNRSKPIAERINDMLGLFNIADCSLSIPYWTDIMYSLERLSPDWTRCLDLIKEHFSQGALRDFRQHMQSRQTEYEQLMVYTVYRYMLGCHPSPAAAALLAYLSYSVIEAIGAAIYGATGQFDLDTQLEIIRLYSCEIEYSTENVGILLDALAENYCNN